MSGYKVENTAEELLAEAREITGIGIIDDAALEPLGIFLKSVNEEGGMHENGAKGMRSRTVRILANRLRMFRDFAAHPEIADQKITSPVILCGLGRSGSTKMLKLIAASGDFNYMPFWVSFNPALLTGDRNENPQARIDDNIAYVEWLYAASPDMPSGHPFAPLEAEEESYLLEHSLRSPTALGWTPMPSFLAWLASQDMSLQFEYLRDTLKYLQWQGLADPAKRWLLKCPLYAGLEREILSVFPDACITMTHRDPVSTVASGTRLLELFYKPFTNSPVAKELQLGQSAMLDAHCHNRENIPGFRVLDLHFKDLVADVETALEKLYAFAGVPLRDEPRAKMLAWEAANPQHKHGSFRYGLADYGLTETDVRKAYAIYDKFLALKFGT